ncbi:hypothetical protein [Sporomusa sp. KB1]|uniref:hypothetical protein n=1 Tax=Sporomusa sp. KB1 TaxID=943346 RepID=UPI00164857D7|nr:hypothetical protein [Sporomusa sp. KB1]
MHELIDAISEGVYAADKADTILIYNRAFERIEATERQSMLGRKDTEVYSLPPMSNLQRRAVLQSKAPLLGQCMTYQLYTGKKLILFTTPIPFLRMGKLWQFTRLTGISRP